MCSILHLWQAVHARMIVGSSTFASRLFALSRFFFGRFSRPRSLSAVLPVSEWTDRDRHRKVRWCKLEELSLWIVAGCRGRTLPRKRIHRAFPRLSWDWCWYLTRGLSGGSGQSNHVRWRRFVCPTQRLGPIGTPPFAGTLGVVVVRL